MDQSSKIVGFVAAAFVVFITVRGELPTYLSFLMGTAAQPQATQSASSTSSSGDNVAAATQAASTIASIAGFMF